MKRFLIGTGAIVGLLTLAVGYRFIGKPVIDIMNRHTDCEPIIPTLKAHQDNVFGFYGGLYNKTMTPALARQLATNLDEQLPKLSAIKVKDPAMQMLHDDLLQQMKLVPNLAREWATLNPTYADYIKLRAKRSGRSGLLTEGGMEGLRLFHYCKYD